MDLKNLEICLMKINKISLGANIIEGPWGGGNNFFKNFHKYFEKKGIKVINHLADEDIDLILLTDPRKSSISSSYTHKDIQLYKKYINPNVFVIQRINECDQRKNTKGLNEFYINANKIADHTVFVSSWLYDLYNQDGFDADFSIILGGGDSDLFKNIRNKSWNKKEKFKIVSHHWSNNAMKGHELYKQLDEIVSSSDLGNKIEVNFIGNFSNKENFKNINFFEPLSGAELVKKLNENNAYITGSLNEPSGNHHIEAAQCGLPILFKKSGGIPEYCNGYGLEYDSENLESKISELMANHSIYLLKMKDYQFSNEDMFSKYENIITNINKSKLETKKSTIVLLFLIYKKLVNIIKLKIFS